MKKLKLLLVVPLLAFTFFLGAKALAVGTEIESGAPFAGEYKLVVEGFDWGPAVNKVVLSLGETVTSADASDFSITATRKSDKGEIPAANASGTRSVGSSPCSG